MRTITVFLAIFLGTWFLSQAELAFVIPLNDTNSFALQLLKKTITLPVLISYSQCYYVYFWRNLDYRKAFVEQLGLWKVIHVKTSETPVTVARFKN
uniref:AhpC-TSA domain-containing protein n=1 Tax=Steinernema glaseri TaxID=37863 RepID=A0A1I7YF86_9BILA